MTSRILRYFIVELDVSLVLVCPLVRSYRGICRMTPMTQGTRRRMASRCVSPTCDTSLFFINNG